MAEEAQEELAMERERERYRERERLAQHKYDDSSYAHFPEDSESNLSVNVVESV